VQGSIEDWLQIYCRPLTLQPKVVSDSDDVELKELMARFEAQNMDVAGDDDSDEEDD
jgi:translation initiation factor 2 subunit 1